MLNLSHLKLNSIAGVVFALFVLTACGGSDSAAPASGGGDDSASTDAGGDGGNTGGGDSGKTAAQCNNDGYNGVDANGACIAYTEATCDKFFAAANSCVAKITDASCTNHTDSPYNNVNPATNTCHDPYTPKVLADFDDRARDADGNLVDSSAENEYSKSVILESVNAAQAYVNIEALIDAGYGAGNVKQAGEGQIISIWSTLNPTVGLGYDDGYVGLADTANPVFVDGYEAQSGNTTDIGVCPDAACRTAYIGTTHSLNGLAGRRDGSGTGIHGIAYNAKIKMLTYGNITPTQAQINAGLAQGGTNGTQNIVAMIHERLTATNDSAVDGKYYITPRDLIPTTELTGTKDVVDAGTMIISHAGAHGANSLNGMLTHYTSIVNRANQTGGTKQLATAYYGSAAAANVANYAANVIDDDLDNDGSVDTDGGFTGKWIVAVGVDASGVIHSTNNGCGATKQYCLSVPEIASALNDDTTMLAVNPAYTLAGAFAVMKGAFPTLNNTQLISLALGTADYLDDDADDATDAIGLVDDTTGKYNAVYGHGLLNLQAATSPDYDISSLSIGNNESIGALWKDTSLTLSSHFGTGLDSVKLGIGDEYGRHFTVKANKITSAPVAVASFDEYMANILADNVQSETLGGQAKLNYSNTAQPWMNLQYTSGKATSKIAFQDNYKVKPLHNDSAASILRANHIRPASNNIGMMDIDYALNGALSLSSYAARGEYDTGYKFDELGTDFDVNYKKSHLNIAIGNIREHDQFLGTHTTGGYALNAPTISRFTDVTYGHDVGNRFNIYANYINYETDVDMLHDQFASIDGLQADQYQIGFTGKSLLSDDDNLNVALITKLGVTDGALNQNTTLGYTADGAFNDVSQSYDLAVNERHQQFEITYQGKIYQNSQDGVSVLKDNRFFTTIRVDQNLNHVQGASQTEIVTGMQARF